MFKTLAAITGGAIAALALTLSLAAQPAAAKTATPECGVSQLSYKWFAGSPGAGQQYATLVFTNTSKTTCRSGGYIGLGFENAKGQKVATHVIRFSAKVRTIVLKPGGKMNTFLHWSDVNGTGDVKGGPCFVAPAKVLITPPNSYTSIHTAWPYGQVCEAGSIQVQPLVAGAKVQDPA